MIQDAERYGAPEGSLRESKRPRTYSSYVALLSDIIDAEPSSFEKQVWKDAMHEETLAPMGKYTSIRAIMELATKLGWKLHQMDVKTIFLNGVVEEEVYVE